jgi:hypothetical protein
MGRNLPFLAVVVDDEEEEKEDGGFCVEGT